MSNKNRKYLMNKIKFQQQLNRKKQQNYNNNFNVLQNKQTYNALQDPHASYHFVSSSVRNHLKHIKNATINQTTHSLQRQRLKKLFKQKIKPKQKSLFNNNKNIQTLQQILTNQAFRKISIQTVHSQRKKSSRKLSQRFRQNQSLHHNKSLNRANFPTISQQLKNPQKFQIGVEQYSRQNLRQFKQQSIKMKGIIKSENESQKQRRKSKTRYDWIHEKKHTKFINFIEEKKKKLKQLQSNIKENDKQIKNN